MMALAGTPGGVACVPGKLIDPPTPTGLPAGVREPPAKGSPGAPTEAEMAQLASDLLFVKEPKLLAQWKRARTLAKRKRQQRREDNNDDAEEKNPF